MLIIKIDRYDVYRIPIKILVQAISHFLFYLNQCCSNRLLSQNLNSKPVQIVQCNTVPGRLGIKLRELQSQPSAPGPGYSCCQCIALANGQGEKTFGIPLPNAKGDGSNDV